MTKIWGFSRKFRYFFFSYYFRGDIVNYTEYLKADYFGNLETHIKVIKNKISKTKYPKIDLWIGETSDAWHSGTPNVSNRFVSAFLWELLFN